MSDGRGRRPGERIAAPVWAGLLSAQERRHLDTVAQEWAGPGISAACLQVVVEAALDDAAADYDRATGSDFLAPALGALRVHIRRMSRRGQSRPAAT